MRVTMFCLVMSFLGAYITPTQDSCVRKCDINYDHCIKSGAFETTCETIYKRCLRRCDQRKAKTKERPDGTEFCGNITTRR